MIPPLKNGAEHQTALWASIACCSFCSIGIWNIESGLKFGKRGQFA
jgi:hypothetical protein